MQPTGLKWALDLLMVSFFLPNCISSASKSPEASNLPSSGIKAAVSNTVGHGYLSLDFKPKL